MELLERGLEMLVTKDGIVRMVDDHANQHREVREFADHIGMSGPIMSEEMWESMRQLIGLERK